MEGNELADLAANAAHSNDPMVTKIFKDDQVRVIKQAALSLWQSSWNHIIDTTGKGSHLRRIKTSVSFWPWSCHRSRVIETVFARLRIGHANFKAHEFRFGMIQSPRCMCGGEETIQHILLHCSIYSAKRNSLIQKLTQLKVPISLRNLLGGGDFEYKIQITIIEHVAEYLFKIGKLYRL